MRDRDETLQGGRWVPSVKAAVVVSCGVIPTIFTGVLVVQALIAGEQASEILGPGLLACFFLATPAALYAAVIRSKELVVVVGVLLLAIEGSSAWGAFTGESSTSALALLWVPFAGIPTVLVAWFIQAMAWPPDG